MKVNVSMPDELFEKYVVKYGLPGTYARMRAAIELCQDLEKDDRAVILCGDNRRAIEKVFQTTVDNPEKLVKLTQNLSRVALGGVDMEFTSAQLERLQMQATFHGRTLEQYIRETVIELRDAMLEKV